jgi:GNAT superfamily N-acetyltransferase
MPNDDRYTIRRATGEDSETLADLRVAFLTEIAHQVDLEAAVRLHETLVRYFRANIPTEQFRAWVAVADGHIVGTSGLVFLHKPASFHVPTGVQAYIMNMYTLPEWRGRGIATALFEGLLAYVRTTDASSVSLHATQEGRPLYAKYGFVGVDDEMELSL